MRFKNEECAKPEIVAVCDANPAALEWFTNRLETKVYIYRLQGITCKSIRLRWIPENVCGKLSKYITERPDGKGGMAKCETWDNATLICDSRDKDGNKFPMTFEIKRMKPGATNEWYLEV